MIKVFTIQNFQFLVLYVKMNVYSWSAQEKDLETAFFQPSRSFPRTSASMAGKNERYSSQFSRICSVLSQ